jgi:hypothetical protein
VEVCRLSGFLRRHIVSVAVPADCHQKPGTQEAVDGPLCTEDGDSNGTWFGTQAGIYLYRAGVGFTRVSNVPGQVAGSCG